MDADLIDDFLEKQKDLKKTTKKVEINLVAKILKHANEPKFVHLGEKLELQSYLWNSAVLLRTNIDAGAYKQYIFPLLFFKRICDVYDEETSNAVDGDTLASPAFIENGKLQQFDLCLANPPYSISQWDRAAFESDKYGRNFLGVPPQGRADYAFLQHIIASLKEDTGRCAILFPHGVLFRNEESTMREKLVRSDRVECVIGLGPNLFYNSPMEACIMICRMTKRPERRGQILFINAVNEVERKNAQSYLEDRHIQRIATAYKNYCDDGDFAKIATIQDIADNNFSLSIPLYVKPEVNEEEIDTRTVQEHYDSWRAASEMMKLSYEKLNAMLGKEAGDNE